MNVSRFPKAVGLFSLAAALAIAAPAFGQVGGGTAQREKTPGSLKAASRPERASGVIMKVERVETGAARGPATRKGAETGRAAPVMYRLTINTAAVWRDWARDQARVKDSGSPAEDAKRGEESVATKGEPADRNTVVVVDVTTHTRVDTRFRAPDDESTKGTRSGETRRSSAKPLQFSAGELKPGLFVEVDYAHQPPQNPVTTVSVIRPILETDRTGPGAPK
jgi:hypothetical protein